VAIEPQNRGHLVEGATGDTTERDSRPGRCLGPFEVSIHPPTVPPRPILLALSCCRSARRRPRWSLIIDQHVRGQSLGLPVRFSRNETRPSAKARGSRRWSFG
jgi:hypothetical protein